MTKKHIHHIFNLAAIILGLNSLNSSVDAMELVVGKEEAPHKQNDREIELKPRVITNSPILSDRPISSNIASKMYEIKNDNATVLEYMQVINALIKFKKCMDWERRDVFDMFIDEEQQKLIKCFNEHKGFIKLREYDKIIFVDLNMSDKGKEVIKDLLKTEEVRANLKQLKVNMSVLNPLLKQMITDLNKKYGILHDSVMGLNMENMIPDERKKFSQIEVNYRKSQEVIKQYNKMFPGLENNPFEDADDGCSSWNSCFGCYCG